MRLTIHTVRGIPRLAGTGVFEPTAHLHNRYREIGVDDPDDPYGLPIYEGIAHLASRTLKPGEYVFYFNDPEFTD